MNEIHVRPLRKGDRDGIARMLERIGEFRKEEKECALELADEALAKGNSERDYAVYCATNGGGGIVGFACYGETPMASGVFDLYWIATDPAARRDGVARDLMRALEERLAQRGARMLVAETSSTPAYEKARAFYERMGFREESRIKDFYARGDDRVTYCKRFERPAAEG